MPSRARRCTEAERANNAIKGNMAACQRDKIPDLQRPDLPQQEHADIGGHDAKDDLLRSVHALPAVPRMQVHCAQPLRQAVPLIGSHCRPPAPAAGQLLPVPHVRPGCHGEDACGCARAEQEGLPYRQRAWPA